MSVAAAVSPHPMRRSARVRWRMPLRITSLRPGTTFATTCETLVVNMHGAGVRSPSLAPLATPVMLESSDHRTTTGWITDFEPIGTDGKWWLLGIALEHPTNFWGVPTPPENWIGQLAPTPQPHPNSPERKFSVWPGAYGPQHAPSAQRSIPAAVQASGLALVAPLIAAEPAREIQPESGVHPIPEVPAESSHAELEKRIADYWSRHHDELEARLLQSTRSMHEELQSTLNAWRAERLAAETKLNELTAARDQFSAQLGSVPDLLRDQAAPVRDELLQHARAQVELLIRGYQDQLSAEREASGSSAQAISSAVEERIRASSAAMLQLRDRIADEITRRAATAMDQLEERIQTNVSEALDQARAAALAEIEQRHQAMAARVDQISAAETAWESRAQAQADELARHSQQLLAELSGRFHQLSAEHEKELSEHFAKRDNASNLAFQSMAGKILASVQQQLRAEVGRYREDFAKWHDNFMVESARIQEQVAHAGAIVGEARQAGNSAPLPENIVAELGERVHTEVGAAFEQMHGPARQQFSAFVTNEIGGVEQRLRALADQLSASVTHKISEDADLKLRETAERDQALRDAFQAASERLERKKSELLTVAASSLEQSRAADAALQQVIEARRTELENLLEQHRVDVTGTQQAIRDTAATIAEHLDKKKAEVSATAAEAHASLQQSAGAVSTELVQQLHSAFDERQKRFDDASATAVQQLLNLEKRANEITALVDVELQRHAEDLIKDTVAEADANLNAVTEAMREEHVAKAKAELQAMAETELQQRTNQLVGNAVASASEQLRKTVDDLRREQVAHARAELETALAESVQQAADAGTQLRSAAAAFQQELERAQAGSSAMRRQVEEAQSWLSRETEQFQKCMHDAWIGASAEIRGRIHQAVEMSDEPINQRVRDIQAQIAKAAEEKAEEFRREADEAQSRVEAAAQQAQSEAEKAVQDRLAQALKSFKDNAGKLAENSISKWDSAVRDTLAELPRLLAEKLSSGNR